MTFIPTCFLFLTILSTILARGLKEEFTWTRLTYEWPNNEIRASFPKSYSDSILFPGGTNSDITTRPSSTSRPTTNNEEFYIYQNNIPMGANIWNNKLFVTVPRRRLGVPSTLNYIWVNNTNHHNVPLIPYPDWNTNIFDRSTNGDRFVSVYRVAVDSCDRLWFVDTGLVEIPGNPQQVQPTTLVIMDLRTDKILHRHIFNQSLLRPTTNLASVTVDITNNQCDEAFAYLPDLGGYGLIVFSLKENHSWRVTHNYFYLEPLAGDFSIGGHNFQWNDGIFSVAISDVKSDGYRDAYFHSMAGFNQYRVSTRILKNETLATRSYHYKDFEFIGNRGELSQASSSDLHKATGVLFLGLVNLNALACWNVATPLSDVSIIQKDNQKMIYPCDVKIAGNNLVVLTNTMPVFLYGNLDYDQINFRVWVESVDTAILGTKCGKRRSRY